MKIEWGQFLTVFLVSLTGAVVVVGLVAVALLEISRRYTPTHTHSGHVMLSSRLGGVVAGACLVAAAAIVLFGLWTLVRAS
jgi:uncharacterized membrane protein